MIAESEREAFESIRDDLAEEIAPQGELGLELTLFDSLLHANWNIRRCRILEAAIMDESSGVDPFSLEEN